MICEALKKICKTCKVPSQTMRQNEKFPALERFCCKPKCKCLEKLRDINYDYDANTSIKKKVVISNMRNRNFIFYGCAHTLVVHIN